MTATLSRRGVLATGGALGIAGALSAMPQAHAAGSALPASKLTWATYGEWSSQADPTMYGRYDPLGVREMPGTTGRYELICRYDRAHVDQMLQLGVPDSPDLRSSAWRGAAWCGTYNVPANGMFAAKMRVPKSPGVGFALMVWPKNDKNWPYGEINIAEGVSGSGRFLTNLHWGTRADHHQDQREYSIDTSQEHLYGVKILKNRIEYYLNNRFLRAINNTNVPYLEPSHLVLQVGALKEGPIQAPSAPYPELFEFRESFTFEPVQIP